VATAASRTKARRIQPAWQGRDRDRQPARLVVCTTVSQARSRPASIPRNRNQFAIQPGHLFRPAPPWPARQPAPPADSPLVCFVDNRPLKGPTRRTRPTGEMGFWFRTSKSTSARADLGQSFFHDTSALKTASCGRVVCCERATGIVHGFGPCPLPDIDLRGTSRRRRPSPSRRRRPGTRMSRRKGIIRRHNSRPLASCHLFHACETKGGSKSFEPLQVSDCSGQIACGALSPNQRERD